METCRICQKQITSKEHYISGECSIEVVVTSKGVIKYGNSRVCEHCFDFFHENEFSKHAKSCKRNRKKTQIEPIQQNQIIEPEENEILRLKSSDLVSLANLSIYCENYLLAAEKPERNMWLETKKNYDPKILFRAYRIFIDSIVKKIPEILPKINLNGLRKIKSIKWKEILESEDDIYQKDLILKRIEKYGDSLQKKIKIALNAMYKKHLYLEEFVVEKTRKIQESFNKRALFASEFLILYKKFIESEIKLFVLLALDLMIIYQAGVRIPSDFDQLEEKVFEILQNNQETFVINQKKTKSKIWICLDKQLIELLKKVEWKGFNFAKEFFERMNLFLSFKFSEMRRGYFCFLMDIDSRKKNESHRLTGHSNPTNSKIYLSNQIHSDLITYKRALRIENPFLLNSFEPGLNILTEPVEKILSDDWFNESSMKLREAFPNLDVEMRLFRQNIEEENILVENEERKIFYRKSKRENCNCGQMTMWECIFCQMYYCENCVPSECQCLLNKKIQAKHSEGQGINSHIEISAEFILKEKHPELEKIKTHIREQKLDFTQVSRDHESLILFNLEKYHNFRIENWDKYEDQNYFPPISFEIKEKIKAIATANIKKNLLIGEFSADLCNQSKKKFLKKKHVLNIYCAKNFYDSVLIGMIHNCGYLFSLDCSNEEVNCEIVLGVFEERIRCLVYAKKEIGIGEALCFKTDSLIHVTHLKIKGIEFTSALNACIQYMIRNHEFFLRQLTEFSELNESETFDPTPVINSLNFTFEKLQDVNEIIFFYMEMFNLQDTYRIEREESVSCLECQNNISKEFQNYFLLPSDLTNNNCEEIEKCSFCSFEKAIKKKRFLKFPTKLIIIHQGEDNFYEKKIKLESEYNLKYIIKYVFERDHYLFIDVEKKTMFDNEKQEPWQEIECKFSYYFYENSKELTKRTS